MSVTLVQIEVRNGDIAKALKLFKKKVENSGHIAELRERRYYKKPSTKKREAKDKLIFNRKVEKILEKARVESSKNRI
jgi:small subunit ribosomal protein S21